MRPQLPWMFAAALAGLFGLATADGPREGESASATPAQNCLAPAAWTVPDGHRTHVTSAATLFAQLAKRDVVLLGENHDQLDHHRWQLQSLAALYAQRPDMVIGFEMF